MKLLKKLSDQAANALKGVEKVLGETKRKIDAVVQDAAKQVNKLADQVAKSSSEMKKKTQAKAAEAGKKYDEVADKVEKAAGDAAAKADGLYNKAAKTADDLAKDAGNKAEELAKDADGKIDGIAVDAKNKITEVASHAGPGAETLTKWGHKCVDKLAQRAKQSVQNAKTLTVNKIAETRSAIAKGFQVARSHVIGAVENTANILKAIYVNAGGWGDGQTDFVIVCGKYVVLCSWIAEGGHLCELKAGDDPQDKVAAEKIVNFLDSAKGKGAANPSMRAYDSAWTPLTADDAPMLLLLGDLHIHLFKESPFDDFCTGFGSSKESLTRDFGKFLDHAHENGLGKEHIIQAGDCFEVWEAQILMDILCDAFVALAGLAPQPLVRKLKPILDAAGKVAPDIWKPLLLNLEAGAKNERAIREEYLKRASPKAVAEIILGKDYANSFSRGKPALGNPLDLTNPAAVEQAIRDAHDPIWEKFTRIWGNHDNNLANKYLQQKYNRSTGASGQQWSRECGKNNCIIVEHGNKLDAFNRREAYDKPNHGFELTRDFNIFEYGKALASEWGGHLWESFTGGVDKAAGSAYADLASAGVRLAQEVGKAVKGFVGGGDLSGGTLQQFCRARAFEIRTDRSEGQAPKRYRVIALGHSHMAEITPGRFLDEAMSVAGQGASKLVFPWLGDRGAEIAQGIPIHV